MLKTLQHYMTGESKVVTFLLFKMGLHPIRSECTLYPQPAHLVQLPELSSLSDALQIKHNENTQPGQMRTVRTYTFHLAQKA